MFLIYDFLKRIFFKEISGSETFGTMRKTAAATTTTMATTSTTTTMTTTTAFRSTDLNS